MHRTLASIAFAAVVTGCGYTPPVDPWFTPDRFISPADTAKLATLFCECVPYRCDHPRDPELHLLAAVRAGRGVSMSDVARFAGWGHECKTGLFRGVDIPDAGPKLRAFKATVRPVN